MENKTTRMMLHWTMEFEDGCNDLADNIDELTTWHGESIRENWRDDIRSFPEEYDRGYYALVGTPAIEKTIDWDWVAEEMNYWQFVRFLFEERP